VSNPAHLIRSVFQLGIAQGLTWIGGAALAVLLPRFLGDVNLGKYTLAFAFTTLIGLGADLGLSTYLTREVARDRRRAATLTTAVLLLRVPLSLLTGGIAIVAAHLMGYDEVTRSAFYVLSVGILVTSVSGVVFGTLQGLHQMKILAITNVLNKLGYAGLAAEDRRDLSARLAANARRLNRRVTARLGPAAARGGRACTGPDGRWGSGQERARRTGMAPPQQDP